jgi:signal transduction histidine kinase
MPDQSEPALKKSVLVEAPLPAAFPKVAAESRLYRVSSENADCEGTPDAPPCCTARPEQIISAEAPATPEDSPLRTIRFNWQLKAVLPVAFVLLNGLLLFLLATVSLRDPERHIVLVVAGAGAVTICAVLIVVLAYLIQRPMVELQEKIARVGEGDLNVSVGFSRRNDEIGDVGRNFNRMVEQLRENREEIERLHHTQMSRAEYLATLGELATGLAHEIRNPLAGIAGVIDIVGRDLPATSPARAVVKDVRQEIARINRIVADLLETARPRPPQIRLSDLNTTVEHAVMLARQQVLSKPIKIELQKADKLHEVEHDSDQIHQVLLNLLLNAVQAIDGAGTIRVELLPDREEAEVVVTDSGRGIPPEHLQDIFRPFYTTKGNGTGLGLSLARRIVEEHHGRIEVMSIVGKGSKFVVRLPFHRSVAGSAV